MRELWSIPPDTIYLNHGSFGPTPVVVQEARRDWLQRLAGNPMRFFVRELEEALDHAVRRLAQFLNAPADSLVFVPNATQAMNIVAANTTLSAGDEVLLNDHEYGAVQRIWGQYCRRSGARVVNATLPWPLGAADEVVAALKQRLSPRTRLIVVSHVTSPTALRLPVEQICAAAREWGIPVCIDGPHAPGLVDLSLQSLNCDFYCASLHKWISAPHGSGFLYVRPSRKNQMQPVTWSWGRSLNGRTLRWKDEFHWTGTADPTAYLAVPAALDFLGQVGASQFRDHARRLVQRAWRELTARSETPLLATDDANLWNAMVTIPLPQSVSVGDPAIPHPLQERLWREHGIEIPIIRWRDRAWIRVSCHLYNTETDINALLAALDTEIPN